jgi:hypothetical protein
MAKNPKFKRIEELWAGEAPTKDLTVSKPQEKDLLIGRIQAAREYMISKAKERIEQMEMIVVQAMAKGEFEVAMEAIKWLQEHTPADENGLRPLDQSVDKRVVAADDHSGPSINIGFNLGGVGKAKELPLPTTEVIDVTPTKDPI